MLLYFKTVLALGIGLVRVDLRRLKSAPQKGQTKGCGRKIGPRLRFGGLGRAYIVVCSLIAVSESQQKRLRKDYSHPLLRSATACS